MTRPPCGVLDIVALYFNKMRLYDIQDELILIEPLFPSLNISRAKINLSNHRCGGIHSNSPSVPFLPLK